jgi:hypothetical protein
MPRFNITLVYQVEAESKYLARLKLAESLRLGVADGVRLDFESVLFDPTSDLVEGDPSSLRLWWKGWFEEVRDQLLGKPKRGHQQPAGKKS